MDEKIPHSRTFSLSLCGTIIFKTKTGTNKMKPSNRDRVRGALTKIGIPAKDSKASTEQDESGPTSLKPGEAFADITKQYPVKAIHHGVFKVPGSAIYDDKYIGDLCFNEFEKEQADTSVARSEGEIQWGNTSGLSVLDDLSKIKATLRSLDTKVDELQAENKAVRVENKTLGDRVGVLEVENKTLGDRVGVLEVENEDLRIDNYRQNDQIRELKELNDLWLDIRNRFMAVYVRDCQSHRHNSFNANIIKKGNKTAHHGEPVADARVFEYRFRTDHITYVELYGLRYERVLNDRGDPRTIEVLGNHTTIKADQNFTSPNKPMFYSAFDKFIKAIGDDSVYGEYRYHDRGPAFQAWRAFQNVNRIVQAERNRNWVTGQNS